MHDFQWHCAAPCRNVPVTFTLATLNSPTGTMHTTLCETFRSLAFRTFDQMGRARRVGHQPLEETFTDLNILELKDRHPTEIFCQAFTKSQEGKNGADWEWWLTDSLKSKWLGLRIQAKVLHLSSNTFAHLHYKSGKTKIYQSTILKRESAKDGLIPLYCLYLHDHSKFHKLIKHCGSFGCLAESYGCSLIPLSHVESLRKKKKANDLNSVISNAHPWHCLVCCPGYGGDSLPERAWNMLSHGMSIPTSPNQTENKSEVGQLFTRVTNEPPPYVRAIAEGQRPDTITTSAWGVVVIKEANRG
ncbi:hypothetical protein NQT62_02195 [Limnobacter humi]|uniref:Uncharacterized protein n=1 Tax=Limnobacter humi TaxID=1778671 RepID=A0ABT1WCK7_9BURK|nr:DUF6615 family protein [Limnobacter humi]MCQ8895248.1 hypothetical protein [Limnobacter humi]